MSHCSSSTFFGTLDAIAAAAEVVMLVVKDRLEAVSQPFRNRVEGTITPRAPGVIIETAAMIGMVYER